MLVFLAASLTTLYASSPQDSKDIQEFTGRIFDLKRPSLGTSRDSIDASSSPSLHLPKSNHKSIYIVGDSEFTEENGVVSGNGTRENPYVIANWVIEANMSIQSPWNTTVNVGIFVANTTKYFIIRNVTVYGGDFAVILDNVSNFNVENSRFYEINSYAILIGFKCKCNNGNITGNEIAYSDSGMWLWGEKFNIKNNYIHNMSIITGTASIGIGVESNDTIVTGNKIAYLRGVDQTQGIIDGILVYPYDETVRDVVVRNNTIRDIYNVLYGEGLIIYTETPCSRALNITMNNNTIYSVSDNGIILDAHKGGIIANTTVTNNTVTMCKNRAILIYYVNGTDIVLKNNDIFNISGIAGIGVEYSAGMLILNNKLLNASIDSVELLRSSNIEIMNNTLLDALGRGVFVYNSSNVVVEGNKINNTGNAGIDLVNVIGAEVKANRVSHTGLAGIHFYNVSSLRVESNNISSTGYDGIGIYSCRNATALYNSISSTGHSGVFVSSGSYLVMEDNSIKNINWSGFDIHFASNVKIIENSISSTGHSGVFVYNSSNVLIEYNEIKNVSWSCVDLTYRTNNTNIAILMNNLSGGGTGVWIGLGNMNVSVHYNNIVGNGFGLSNDLGNPEVNATLNWWGEINGPSGAGYGSGQPVSSNVKFSPWLNAPYPAGRPISYIGASKGSATLTPQTTLILNASSTADTLVYGSGTGSILVSVMKYLGNPANVGLKNSIKFIDVNINNPSVVTKIIIRIYYRSSELNNTPSGKVIPYWWDEEENAWKPCNVFTRGSASGDYVGYVEIVITNRTRPSIANLTGLPIALGSPPSIGGSLVMPDSSSSAENNYVYVISSILVIGAGIYLYKVLERRK